MKKLGLILLKVTRIVPVMLTMLSSQTMADELLKKEFMLLGSFPVVPG
jgi:hypothetical protein